MTNFRIVLIFIMHAYLVCHAAAFAYEPSILRPDDLFQAEDLSEKHKSNEKSLTTLERAPQVKLPVRFVLNSEVEVKDPEISLNAIASCSGDMTICEEIYAVKVGQAPDPGKRLILNRSKIAEILHREWPGIQLELTGSTAVKIKAAFENIEKEAIIRRIEDYLQFVSKDGQDWRLRIDQVKVASGEKIRPGSCQIEIPHLVDLASRSFDWVVRHLQGTRKIEALCRYLDESTSPSEFVFSARTLIERRVLVANRDLSRGAIVNPKDFSIEWLALQRDRRNLLTNNRDLNGRRLARAVAAGQPFVDRDLVSISIVKRGQILRLLMQRGNLEVSSQIRALTGGSYGQLIEAMSINTNKKIRVRIKDAETVEYAGLN